MWTVQECHYTCWLTERLATHAMIGPATFINLSSKKPNILKSLSTQRGPSCDYYD